MKTRLYLFLMYAGAGLVGVINMLILGDFITRQGIINYFLFLN